MEGCLAARKKLSLMNILARAVKSLIRAKHMKHDKKRIRGVAMAKEKSFGVTILRVTRVFGLWAVLSASMSVIFGALNHLLTTVSERHGGAFMDSRLVFNGGIFVYLVYFSVSLWGSGGILISSWFHSRVWKGVVSATYGLSAVVYFIVTTITDSWGEVPINMGGAPIVAAACAILSFALSISSSFSRK